MASAALPNLVKLLEAGRDDALLRFSLGAEYLKAGEGSAAADHLRAAIRHDPAYSAAWKLLGRALESINALADARDAFTSGAAVAARKGDLQAAKEMSVFARRVARKLESIS